MSTVSRRGLLHMTAGTAGALGITTLATELSAMSTLAPREPESSAADPQAAASGSDLFYRDDWLGAPWVKPEVALLIHGNDESSVSWFGWIPRMAQEFRLVRPDLPGFGNSSIPQNFEWSMPSLATTLAQLLDRLGVDSAHIIGAKMGGAIAMQFAADYPRRTRTLTVVSGPASRVAANIPFTARLLPPSKEDSVPRLRKNWWNIGTPYGFDEAANESRHGESGRSTQYGKCFAAHRRARAGHHIRPQRAQSVETVLRYQQKIQNSRLLVLPSDAYHLAVIKPDDCVSNVLSFIKDATRIA